MYERRDPPTPCEVLHDDGRWYPGRIIAVYRQKDGRWRAIADYRTRAACGCPENRGGGFHEDRVRPHSPDDDEEGLAE